MQSLAKLRAALLLVDTAPLAEMEARIGDLAATGNVWRHTARELLGLAAWRTGDYAAARKYFEQITTDQDVPQDVSRRAPADAGADQRQAWYAAARGGCREHRARDGRRTQD